MPHPLSHKCPIPLFQLCLTSHFMCVQSFHMVNIDVPAGVGAPPLDTTSRPLQILWQWFSTSINYWEHGNTHLYVSKGTPWRVLHAKFRYNVCSKYACCRYCTRATRALYAWGITSLDTTKQLTLALAGASMALFCLFKSPPHCCKTGASSFEVGRQRNLL